MKCWWILYPGWKRIKKWSAHIIAFHFMKYLSADCCPSSASPFQAEETEWFKDSFSTLENNFYWQSGKEQDSNHHQNIMFCHWKTTQIMKFLMFPPTTGPFRVGSLSSLHLQHNTMCVSGIWDIGSKDSNFHAVCLHTQGTKEIPWPGPPPTFIYLALLAGPPWNEVSKWSKNCFHVGWRSLGRFCLIQKWKKKLLKLIIGAPKLGEPTNQPAGVGVFMLNKQTFDLWILGSTAFLTHHLSHRHTFPKLFIPHRTIVLYQNSLTTMTSYRPCCVPLSQSIGCLHCLLHFLCFQLWPRCPCWLSEDPQPESQLPPIAASESDKSSSCSRSWHHVLRKKMHIHTKLWNTWCFQITDPLWDPASNWALCTVYIVCGVVMEGQFNSLSCGVQELRTFMMLLTWCLRASSGFHINWIFLVARPYLGQLVWLLIIWGTTAIYKTNVSFQKAECHDQQKDESKYLQVWFQCTHESYATFSNVKTTLWFDGGQVQVKQKKIWSCHFSTSLGCFLICRWNLFSCHNAFVEVDEKGLKCWSISCTSKPQNNASR